MKRSLLIALLLLATLAICAAPVSKQATSKIAKAFYREHGGSDSLVEAATQFSHLRIYVGSKGSGFVITSTDDAAMPILAYSVQNPFETTDIPINTAEWLQQYDDQIAYIEAHNIESTESIQNEWRHATLMGLGLRRIPAQSSGSTANLLTTTWSQKPYYNQMCPYDSARAARSVTGCVATAMGQIMKFWDFPQNGIGSHSYSDSLGTHSATFSNANYDWTNMPNNLNSASTATEVNAIAKLLYHIGVAVEMDYSCYGSGAFTTGKGNKVGYASAENAYREIFKYKHTAHSMLRANYTDTAWYALLKSEIDSGRPMQFAASDSLNGGHSFVCCGYDNTGKLYFNWGWGGSGDGNYYVGNLNPRVFHFTLYNRAVIGIEPDRSTGATTVVSFTRNIPNAGTETGAGTYVSYQDTVTILATASAGYLFDCWDASNVYNPYKFIANGGNVSHRANYHLVKGDSISYCSAENKSAYGYSSRRKMYWGIRFDTISLTANRKLQRVRYYSTEMGTYYIRIYKGGVTAPQTLLLIDTVTTTTDDGWESFNLSTPVMVDTTQPLWIIFESNNVKYPMSYSEYRGNNDGAWAATDTTRWRNYVSDSNHYIEWQIEGIFAEDTVQQFAITVTSNNDAWGVATGGGTYRRGDIATLTAVANDGYKFVRWDDGDTTSTRNVVVAGDASYQAIFQSEPTKVDDVNKADYVVSADGSSIIVKGASGQIIFIFDAQGKMIAERDNASEIERFSIQSGVYFVRINATTNKIVVR